MIRPFEEVYQMAHEFGTPAKKAILLLFQQQDHQDLNSLGEEVRTRLEWGIEYLRERRDKPLDSVGSSGVSFGN